MNTLNLLHVMRKYRCDKIIFSSTCATYGEPEKVSITEGMSQKPINSYGETKLTEERNFRNYERAYGLKYAVLWYSNAADADSNGRLGETMTWRCTSPHRAVGPVALVGSSEKARCILGWEPKFADIDIIVDHAWKWQNIFHGKKGAGKYDYCI